MISHGRWRENWLVVGPPGAARVNVTRRAAKRRAPQQSIRELRAGTPVVLRATGPGARRRCAGFACEAGIELEREYLAFPSAVAPAYLVEDAPAPIRMFVQNVLVTPPGMAWSTPVDASLGLLRALRPWRLVRA